MTAHSYATDPRFDITANRHGGNQESAEAHRGIIPNKARMQADILAFFRKRGTMGATADEVAEAFACSHNHVAPRISELKALGQLLTTSQRVRTRSGAMARVLVAKE